MEIKEIIHALLVHANKEIDCNLCPYYNRVDCDELLINDAVHLIITQYRPQAEWIPNIQKSSSFINPGRHCSLCGKNVEFSENYCPNCGAEMRGIKNE